VAVVANAECRQRGLVTTLERYAARLALGWIDHRYLGVERGIAA